MPERRTLAQLRDATLNRARSTPSRTAEVQSRINSGEPTSTSETTNDPVTESNKFVAKFVWRAVIENHATMTTVAFPEVSVANWRRRRSASFLTSGSHWLALAQSLVLRFTSIEEHLLRMKHAKDAREEEHALGGDEKQARRR